MRENALELHGVCKKYGGFALRNVEFTLPRGTVMGLIGENGAGKTTTIKAVLDLIRPDSGEIAVLGGHGSNPFVREKIGVVLEDGGFPSTMSAVQVSTLLGRAYKNWNAEQFASYIEKFGIDREKAIKDYSKGMKTKLNLAAALSHGAELLLLDEPTNDLDIGTLTILEDYLESFAGTVITVSHDRYFLDKVASDLLIFKGQARIERYTGMFTDYLSQETHAKKESVTPQKSSANSSTEDKKVSKEKTKLTYAEQMEFDKLEKEIDDLDERKAELQEEMNNVPGSDYGKLGDLQRQIDEIDQRSEEAMERWEYLGQYV